LERYEVHYDQLKTIGSNCIGVITAFIDNYNRNFKDLNAQDFTSSRFKDLAISFCVNPPITSDISLLPKAFSAVEDWLRVTSYELEVSLKFFINIVLLQKYTERATVANSSSIWRQYYKFL
jgi:hypothetical protein